MIVSTYNVDIFKICEIDHPNETLLKYDFVINCTYEQRKNLNLKLYFLNQISNIAIDVGLVNRSSNVACSCFNTAVLNMNMIKCFCRIFIMRVSQKISNNKNKKNESKKQLTHKIILQVAE